MMPSSQPASPGPDAGEMERMEKEAITLEDGRTLTYYRFVPEAP